MRAGAHQNTRNGEIMRAQTRFAALVAGAALEGRRQAIA
jgi:hypothetical protein